MLGGSSFVHRRQLQSTQYWQEVVVGAAWFCEREKRDGEEEEAAEERAEPELLHVRLPAEALLQSFHPFFFLENQG